MPAYHVCTGERLLPGSSCNFGFWPAAAVVSRSATATLQRRWMFAEPIRSFSPLRSGARPAALGNRVRIVLPVPQASPTRNRRAVEDNQAQGGLVARDSSIAREGS